MDTRGPIWMKLSGCIEFDPSYCLVIVSISGRKSKPEMDRKWAFAAMFFDTKFHPGINETIINWMSHVLIPVEPEISIKPVFSVLDIITHINMYFFTFLSIKSQFILNYSWNGKKLDENR